MAKPTTIRLRKMWRRQPAGQVVTTLGHGVASVLVRRGIAEWHDATTATLDERPAVLAGAEGGELLTGRRARRSR